MEVLSALFLLLVQR